MKNLQQKIDEVLEELSAKWYLYQPNCENSFVTCGKEVEDWLETKLREVAEESVQAVDIVNTGITFLEEVEAGTSQEEFEEMLWRANKERFEAHKRAYLQNNSN